MGRLLRSGRFPSVELIAYGRGLGRRVGNVQVVRVRSVRECLAKKRLLLAGVGICFKRASERFQGRLGRLRGGRIDKFVVGRRPSVMRGIGCCSVLLGFYSRHGVPIVRVSRSRCC